MAKQLEIKMATVMEEGFDNDDYSERAESFFIGEESSDMTFIEKSNTEENLSNTSDEGDGRRDSLVEKDVEILDSTLGDVIETLVRGDAASTPVKGSNESKELISEGEKLDISVHLKIPQKPTSAEDKSGSERSNASKRITGAGDKKQSRLPKSTSPSATSSKSFTFPMPAKNSRISSGVSTLTKNKTFTLTAKDKFVTELSFYHPFSFLRSKMINLGIFLSTSRAYGDHYVYKISPLSPFKNLNLQPQDRLKKINDFEISSWPHNTVVNFVKHLSQNDQSRFENPDSLFKFTFSIEFIPVNRPSLSAEASPVTFLASLEVIMQPNGRTSIGASSITPTRFEYQNETSCKLLRLYGESGYYVKVEETSLRFSNSASQNNETLLRVVAGEMLIGDNSARIRFHKFNMVPMSLPGEIVALETFRRGTFLSAGSAVHGSSLSLLTLTNSTDIRNISSIDTLLFRIFSSDGDNRIKIQNIQSGLFVKAVYPTVSLVRQPFNQEFPNSMLFTDFDC